MHQTSPYPSNDADFASSPTGASPAVARPSFWRERTLAKNWDNRAEAIDALIAPEKPELADKPEPPHSRVAFEDVEDFTRAASRNSAYYASKVLEEDNLA